MPNLARPPWRRLPLLTLIVGASVAWACAPKQAGRDVGTIATEAWNHSRDTMTSAARQLVRAAGGELARSVRDSLRPSLDSALSGLLQRLEASAGRIEDSLAVFAGTALRDSVRQTLQVWVAGLSSSVRTDLGPELGRALELAVARAGNGLAATLGSDSLRRAVVTLADSVVTQAIAAIGRESRQQTRRLPWWVWGLGIGFGVAVLALVGLFIVNLKRIKEREASLRLVTLAVQERGDLAIKNRVKELATEHGVEPWLNGFLREQRLLLPGDHRGTS